MVYGISWFTKGNNPVAPLQKYMENRFVIPLKDMIR